MKKDVTITYRQRKRYSKLGNSLIKKKLTTGFQLEDFNPRQKRKLIYGHDSPEHLQEVKKKIGGKIYPRESYYQWNKNWKT